MNKLTRNKINSIHEGKYEVGHLKSVIDNFSNFMYMYIKN